MELQSELNSFPLPLDWIGQGLHCIDIIFFLCNFYKGHIKPHFDNRCKVFELDPCDGFGKVCLVYKDIKAGMWLWWN